MTNGGSMVSEFQTKISDLLYKYLADKHVKCPELASSRFGKAIECVSLCEEITIIINKKSYNFGSKYLELKFKNIATYIVKVLINVN